MLYRYKTVNLNEDEERPGVKRATVIENAQVLANVAFRTPDGKKEKGEWRKSKRSEDPERSVGEKPVYK